MRLYRSRIGVVLLSILLMSILVVVAGKIQDLDNEKQEEKIITIWYWEDDIKEYAKWYTENVDSSIKFKFVDVLADEYYQKWILTYMRDDDLQDIAILENSYRQRLMDDEDAWVDLSQDGYGVNTEDFIQYIRPYMMNSRGEVVSVDMGLTPVCLAYKRDLIQKYLGVSEPEELESILLDWDSLMNVGEKINIDSDGQVFMFANISDLITIVKSQAEYSIINKDGVINEKVLRSVISKLKLAYDKKIIDPKLFGNKDGMVGAIASDYTVMSICPIWGPDSIIKKYAPNSKGRWGIIDVPGGSFTMGGAGIAISSKSKVKDEAFDFIKNIYMNEGIIELPSYKTKYEDNPDREPKPVEEYFSGQNITNKFIQVAKGINTINISEYSAIEDRVIEIVLEDILLYDKSIEDVVLIAKNMLQNELEIMKNE